MIDKCNDQHSTTHARQHHGDCGEHTTLTWILEALYSQAQTTWMTHTQARFRGVPKHVHADGSDGPESESSALNPRSLPSRKQTRAQTFCKHESTHEYENAQKQRHELQLIQMGLFEVGSLLLLQHGRDDEDEDHEARLQHQWRDGKKN